MKIISYKKRQPRKWNENDYKKIIELKKNGLTDKLIALQMETSDDMVKKILCQLRKNPKYKIPYVSYIPDEKLSELSTMFPKYNDYLKVKEKDVMIISDLHLPYIKLNLWHKCKAIAKKEKISSLIIAGDIANQDAFTHYVSATGRGSHRQEKRVIETFFDDCLYNFNKVYFIAGNHDLRFFKLLLGEVDIPDWFKMFTDQINKRIFVSANYRFLTLNDKIMISHPKQYRQNAPSVAKDLASKYQMHQVIGHGHHFGLGFERSGKFWAVEMGGLIDGDKTEYNAMCPTTHPAWNGGFLTIKDYVYPTIFVEGMTNFNTI